MVRATNYFFFFFFSPRSVVVLCTVSERVRAPTKIVRQARPKTALQTKILKWELRIGRQLGERAHKKQSCAVAAHALEL